MLENKHMGCFFSARPLMLRYVLIQLGELVVSEFVTGYIQGSRAFKFLQGIHCLDGVDSLPQGSPQCLHITCSGSPHLAWNVLHHSAKSLSLATLQAILHCHCLFDTWFPWVQEKSLIFHLSGFWSSYKDRSITCHTSKLKPEDCSLAFQVYFIPYIQLRVSS